jgi:hypothetical protein
MEAEAAAAAAAASMERSLGGESAACGGDRGERAGVGGLTAGRGQGPAHFDAICVVGGLY